jgi:nicotinamidase-related amidase
MASRALIILDMQKGNFKESQPIFNGEELVSKIESLIAKMRSANVPIIYIQNNGGPGDPDEPGTLGWEIHTSIEPCEGDLVIQKSYPDAFHGTVLQKELDSRGIKKIIIVGLQSEYCIDTTCRRAFSLNYDVILVEDAHSTWPSDLLTPKQIISHHNSVLGDWFVTLMKTTEILNEDLRYE